MSTESCVRLLSPTEAVEFVDESGDLPEVFFIKSSIGGIDSSDVFLPAGANPENVGYTVVGERRAVGCLRGC